VSDWRWEYLSGAEETVGGLPDEQRAEVEVIARRLADAAEVKYLGDPPAAEAGRAPVQTYAEGRWMLWFQEYRVRQVVYILSVQRL
jgi:hypothetical protein